jgi:hypothetical protein
MHCPPADSSAAGFLLGGREREMSVETLRSSRRAPSPREKCHSVPKIVPLPGGLYAEWKRCNKMNCRCSEGGETLHGPHLYRRWVENGRRRRQYVRAADADRVRAGIAEWRRLHPPARSTRELLAELRRLFREVDAWEE